MTHFALTCLAADLGLGSGVPWGWLGALIGAAGCGSLALAWRRQSLELRARLAQLEAEVGAVGVTPAADSDGVAPSVSARLGRILQGLRAQRHAVEQGQKLLFALIDAAPMAILLLEEVGEIEYANETARELFFDGREVGRANFLELMTQAPAALREAVLELQDRLFTVEQDGVAETYHLSKRHFELHGTTHTLLMVKHLTRELRRQEVDVWKKLIRVLSHELNNSLAPVSSLMHSVRLMTKAEPASKLERALSTIEERISHLQGFVEGYARFARLPKPRCEWVKLVDFLHHLEVLAPQARVSSVIEGASADCMVWFDRSQMEQVAINLLKNAREAGGPESEIELRTGRRADGGTWLEVTDRGSGMSEQVLQHALLPFYSTKEQGTGLGLALCREILEAHGGTIELHNREGGGLRVLCALPGRDAELAPASAKLTLSRL